MAKNNFGMEISEIKQRLTMAMVLHYYGLKADRNNRIKCPFHEDTTPSYQVYYKTQTGYCFSSRCKTHGKSMDVIDFVMHKENCSKAKAIEKCKEILGYTLPGIKKLNPVELSREQFLGQMWQYFKNAVHNSNPAKEYIAGRSLDYKKIEVGYNAAQFHHGVRRNEDLIARCLEHGLLLDKNQKGRTGEKAYSVFGKWCICFALKNKNGEISGMYFRSILNDKDNKHFYLKERKGLYPCYPEAGTKTLILTESIIDCASLLQIENLKSEVENLSVLACYGTNGLGEEHQSTIKGLDKLQEIIFCFDMDEAGREAVKKYAGLFREELPSVKLTVVELPCKDVNETLQGHDESIFTELLKDRKEIPSKLEAGNTMLENQDPEETFSFSAEEKKSSEQADPEVREEKPSLGIPSVMAFLQQKDLLSALNHQIGLSGIVGEENSRLLLFLITLSYLNKHPLHGLVQGSSGSGKTHLISRIADMMPPEDVLRFTRITESSLYNWGEFDLYQKIIVIEDLDGLKEDALYALREFISSQRLSSSISLKDKKGNHKGAKKEVRGQFSSLSATTKGDTYEDNMSRSFLIAVDESSVQTRQIIHYQNRRVAGEIDPGQQQKALNFIRQVVRQLKPYQVVNPYATKLNLPEKVHKARRLNEMYQSVIKQVTLLNQYQREHTQDHRLITDLEDIEQATEILFESIVLKVDELDGSLRQFYERLKKYVKDENRDFVLRDVRQALGISKTQMFRHINQLLELEYIKQSGGYPNKGLKYKISYWDNYQKLRTEIKDFLMLQIEKLRSEAASPSKPKNQTLSMIVGRNHLEHQGTPKER